MPVTRSTFAERTQRPERLIGETPASRGLERLLLLAASLLIAGALMLTAQARLARLSGGPGGNPEPATAQPGAAQPLNTKLAPLNLSSVERREQLLPYLQAFASPVEAQYTASQIFLHLPGGGNGISHVGQLGQIRVPIGEVLSNKGLTNLRQRAAQIQSTRPGADSMLLLTSSQVAQLKPLFVVRDAARFRKQLALWVALFLSSFLAVHLYWTVRGVRGPQFLLPSLLLLSGIGMTLMVTLRDPLRDTLAFANFAEGVAAGCLVLAIGSTLDYRRISGKLSYVFLLGGLVLSAALIVFGSGPTGSDAKVNLFGFQPAEVVRVLIVFFLAGYFAERWQSLRALRETRPGLAKVSRWVEVPRLEYLVPVLAGVIVSLGFFFLQKDLGPALLIACLFLAMYAVARDRYLLAAAGLVVILSGFASGYYLHIPSNVAGRVSMWLSPWDNSVKGGEQVAQSFWGFSSGGLFGTGPGLGDPQLMPAAHTDLILAVLGEEWGFAGVACVLAIYAVLVWFGIRTALRARSGYNFFLALGLTLAFALQIALIGGGVLGLIPLSGVVVPFLSYGRTALVTNFAMMGVLFSLARDGSRADERAGAANPIEATRPFQTTTRALSYVLAAIGGVLLLKAGYLQIVRADAVAGAGALAVQADGERRFEYNPRLLAIARSIPRGTIYDRNGLPLATSDWNEIANHRDAYTAAGIPISDNPEPGETRFYPLGPRAFHLLGDLRTRANWSAHNSSLAERDFLITLQGFDDRATVVEVADPQTKQRSYKLRSDYRELLPLLRHRWQPNNPEVKRVRDRDRNLHMTIDARLQWRAADLLEAQLRKLDRTKGAVVIMDPASGDLLASVSYPWPSDDSASGGAALSLSPNSSDSDDPLLDRARYGLYPPGSSFKLVTAIAALRKDPANASRTYECKRLPDGRTGNFVKGWGHPIHDDIKDTTPHGTIAMRAGLIVSCNAYFAQLGTYAVGAEALLDTADRLGISVSSPSTADALRKQLPQASYGQGQVVASPFQMARVAATIAQNGSMPYGRWVTDESNPRRQGPQAILAPQLAAVIGESMRAAVRSGTGRAANMADLPIAGKTGTAELEHAPSHAWFIGFAPYGGTRRLAFAVLIENGQYGGTAAAPLAADLMKEARAMGYLGGAQ